MIIMEDQMDCNARDHKMIALVHIMLSTCKPNVVGQPSDVCLA